jgi:hypothetical protein
MRKSIIVSAKKGDKSVTHLSPVGLGEAGIREVQDLQNWVLARPEVLGEPLLILDDQFKDFEKAKDRLDILCVDRKGHLVVVELKRSDTADYADLQALRYAAMMRSFTLADASRILSESRLGREGNLNEDDARRRITEFMGVGEEGDAPAELSEPRIIIASSGFSDQILITADYLRAHDIDVTCVSLSAYPITEDRFILVPDVVLPIQEIADYTCKVRKKEEARQTATQIRAPPSLSYLFDKGEIKGGEVLLLKHSLPESVQPHYKDTDPRFRATVQVEDGTPKLRWERDGSLYSPSELAAKVFKELRPDHPKQLSLSGSVHWGTLQESLWAWRNRIIRSSPK